MQGAAGCRNRWIDGPSARYHCATRANRLFSPSGGQTPDEDAETGKSERNADWKQYHRDTQTYPQHHHHDACHDRSGVKRDAFGALVLVIVWHFSGSCWGYLYFFFSLDETFRAEGPHLLQLSG